MHGAIVCYEVKLGFLRHVAKDDERLLMMIAGSICKDFSSMGDGKRLVGQHAARKFKVHESHWG